jgi:regulator of ribosome biosynthesis
LSHLELDVGNLCAFDPSPLNPEDFTPLNRSAKCLEVATAMTQALVTQLFGLPGEAVQGGRLAELPAPTTALPREKPIPKPKPLTKWQKFAQVRGGGGGQPLCEHSSKQGTSPAAAAAA